MKKAPRGDYSVYAEKGDGTYVKVFEDDYTRSDAPEVTVTKLVTDKSPEVRPDYYKCGNLECFDIIWYIADETFDNCNMIKYIFRAGNKDSEIEDLMKARTYALNAMRGDDRPLGTSKRDVIKSDLPVWKKRLIVHLMDLTLSPDDDCRKESYQMIIDEIDDRIAKLEKESGE